LRGLQDLVDAGVLIAAGLPFADRRRSCGIVWRCQVNRVAARRAARELVLVAALFLAYKLGRIVVEGHVEEAMRNAASVWDFERVLHLPSEAALQGGLLSHTFWVRAANCFYAYVHFPATAATLIWMYVKRPQIYLWMRRTLATLTAFALVVHALYPLAPPRMLGAAGMVDTGRLFGPSVYGSPSTDTLSNQYAAMPSLHVGWAVVVALALVAATSRRGWRWLWMVHPVITLLVVVVTGNHYWVDAVAALGLLAVVVALVPRPTAGQPAAVPVPSVFVSEDAPSVATPAPSVATSALPVMTQAVIVQTQAQVQTQRRIPQQRR
jgi:hypothetical protein